MDADRAMMLVKRGDFEFLPFITEIYFVKESFII